VGGGDDERGARCWQEEASQEVARCKPVRGRAGMWMGSGRRGWGAAGEAAYTFAASSAWAAACSASAAA
jgi:hypothetical protein